MRFRKLRLGCLGISILMVGLLGGLGGAYYLEKASHTNRLVERLDGYGIGPVRPVFLRDEYPCEALSAADRRLDVAMLEAERAAAAIDPGGEAPVHHEVVSYFAWHWRASADHARCEPSPDMIRDLAPYVVRAGWPKANTPLNDLRLAERLPSGASLAKGLAGIGFLAWIPPSALAGEDSRPYARQLLAEQGTFAAPWKEMALREIGGDTRLGTSAGFLAVAVAPGEALPQVRDAMRGKLSRSLAHPVRAYRTGGEVLAIRSGDANRLIELGYALARGGAQAEPYAQPVIDMLDQTVARPAPPFGLLAAEPTEFCRIARHIGGRAREAADRKSFCAAGFKGGDGAPRQF